jgi:hypothetical protein
MNDTKSILRAAARASGWQVLITDDPGNCYDTYLLAGAPAKRIVVRWSSGGWVLTAQGDDGAERSYIDRWDGHPDPSLKTGRVLSALAGRTHNLPLERNDAPHAGEPDPVCCKCFLVHYGECQ